ncbi:MAG: LysM peptidoglycan-binding domain-containing protein [Microgenomates group bacterium]
MDNKKTIKKVNYKKLVINILQQKYHYFLIGITLSIIFYLTFVGFFLKNKILKFKTTTPTPTKTKKETQVYVRKYIVKNGDYLWKIAEEVYGSGYNAYDIAQINKINDPNVIFPGQELILPTVSPKPTTKGEVATASFSEKRKITETKYIIKEGDYLWKIALEAYGDGYAWKKIAFFNKLTNPDIIHPGNVLILPQ